VKIAVQTLRLHVEVLHSFVSGNVNNFFVNNDEAEEYVSEF